MDEFAAAWDQHSCPEDLSVLGAPAVSTEPSLPQSTMIFVIVNGIKGGEDADFPWPGFLFVIRQRDLRPGDDGDYNRHHCRFARKICALQLALRHRDVDDVIEMVTSPAA